MTQSLKIVWWLLTAGVLILGARNSALHDERYVSDDHVIADEIRVALEQDSRLPHPTEVRVSEQPARWLCGQLASPGQRRAAVQIAKAVAGVAHVEDELRVDPRDRLADDQIRGVAIQALMTDSEVPEDRIEVGAVDGWLSLDGEISAPVREQRGVRSCVRRPRSGDLEQRPG